MWPGDDALEGADVLNNWHQRELPICKFDEFDAIPGIQAELLPHSARNGDLPFTAERCSAENCRPKPAMRVS